MDTRRFRTDWTWWLALAVKLSLGSMIGIAIARLLRLEFSGQAGIIAIFTMMTTRKGTLRLSLTRIISFLVSCLIISLAWRVVEDDLLAFGIFILILVFISQWLDWMHALSVNAVFGMHCLSMGRADIPFLINEGMIVLIGILVAIVLNFFHANYAKRARLHSHIEEAEEQMKRILMHISDYLYGERRGREVWDEIEALEEKMAFYEEEADEYEGNSSGMDSDYYKHYFLMRRQQLDLLNNLHASLHRIKSLPSQSRIVVEYVQYLSNYVVEMNDPADQIKVLQDVVDRIREDDLPKTREEFENRAVLYHIMMDLEDFLLCKQKFIKYLDHRKKDHK